MPLENVLAIRVDPAESEDREKQNHGEKSMDAERAQHEHPRKQKHGERVEDDEDERDQIEADGKLDPGAADRLGAALVRVELRGEGPPRAQHPRHPERHDRKRDDEAEIDDDREITVNGSGLGGPKGPPLHCGVDLEPYPLE